MEIENKKRLNTGAIIAIVLIVLSLACTCLGMVSLDKELVSAIEDLIDEAKDGIDSLEDFDYIDKSDAKTLEKLVDVGESCVEDGAISLLEILAANGAMSELMDLSYVDEVMDYSHDARMVRDIAEGGFSVMVIGTIVILVLLLGCGIMAVVNNFTGGKWWTLVYALIWTLIFIGLALVVIVLNVAVEEALYYMDIDAMFSVAPTAVFALIFAYAGFIVRFATKPKAPKAAPGYAAQQGYNPYGQQQGYGYGQQPQNYGYNQQPQAYGYNQQPQQEAYVPPVAEPEPAYNPAADYEAFLNTPTTPTCVSCGKELDGESKFCPYCGSQQG